MLDLTFSSQWLWRLLSSGMWRRVCSLIEVERRFEGPYYMRRDLTAFYSIRQDSSQRPLWEPEILLTRLNVQHTPGTKIVIMEVSLDKQQFPLLRSPDRGMTYSQRCTNGRNSEVIFQKFYRLLNKKKTKTARICYSAHIKFSYLPTLNVFLSLL
jgi:hypothetical protein